MCDISRPFCQYSIRIQAAMCEARVIAGTLLGVPGHWTTLAPSNNRPHRAGELASMPASLLSMPCSAVGKIQVVYGACWSQEQWRSSTRAKPPSWTQLHSYKPVWAAGCGRARPPTVRACVKQVPAGLTSATHLAIGDNSQVAA